MSLTWTPPGPGQWALDRSHSHHPATPLNQFVMSAAMTAGMRRVFREFGVPADTLDLRFVNGLMYTRLRPLIGADRPRKTAPPAAVLKLMLRWHPEMRRRARQAERTFAERPWRQVVADWESTGRAEVEAHNLELQDVDLGALSDTELVAQVKQTIGHLQHTMELHFWLHGSDLGPIGLLLYEARQWGLTPEEILPLLEGASPATAAPTRSLARIRAAVEAAGAHPTTLDELRAVSAEVAADLDTYLRYRGWVLFSRYDLDGITLAERPDLVLASVLTAQERVAGEGIEQRIAAVRERVPAAQRERFDELVGEARASMGLRDDNGPTTAEWPMGLVRRALLEMGRRMAARGSVYDVEHVVELRPDEIKATLLAGKGPGADELARRARERRTADVDDAPTLLGTPEPAPPLALLPPAMARMVSLVQMVIAQTGMDGSRARDGLQGTGVGSVPYRGRARRADTPEEALEHLEPGDVLVVPCTTPAYNVVLSLAGAVVTSEGGPLSHAAVLARELGIPAVVGAFDALRRIPDGVLVEVDPVEGRVTVL